MSIRLKDTIYDLVNLSNTSTTIGNSSVKLYVQNNDEVNFGGTPTNGSTTIYFGYRSVDSRTIPSSYIFGGSTGSATVTASGFKKKDSSDSYVLLGAGGHKAVSDFAVSSHTHTRSQITDFPTSMPASDVYAWAKAATKPSYNFGEIGAGVATIGDGTNRIMWRTNASYASGVYYSTPANESVVFANKLNVTSWMFVTGDPTAQASWQTFTPSLQIKNQRVTINKAIATGTDAEYNLDVNGSFNATSGYINKNAIIHAGNIGSQSVSYATSAGSANTATSATSATTATTAKKLLTNNTSQGGDACYDETPGLHFYRYNGDKTGNNDGFIMQWSWNSGSVGGQIFLDDNPSKTMMIRGRNNDANKTFTNTWATFLHSENYTTYTVKKDGTGATLTWGISISGNAATATSATSATTAGSANVATIARVLGSDDSMKLYANYSNEVNFGGTNNSSTIFFGYRATDSKPIPTSFIFGGDTGTASITANKFIKKGSSASYVLLGNGDHKAVSDFATSGHTHSGYLTSLPSHTHDYLPLSGGSMTGSFSIKETTNILLRPNNSNYTSGIGYDTSGNECIALWAKNTVTRLRWHAGTDMSSLAAGTMMGITPDFEISKASGSAIGYIAGSTILTSANYGSHSHSYLPLSGGTMSGCITTPGNDTVVIKPAKHNYDQIGASDCYFWKAHVTNAYFTTLYLGGEQITFTT